MPKKCLKCLKSAKNATFLAFKAYNSITVSPSWGKKIWGRHIFSTLQDKSLINHDVLNLGLHSEKEEILTVQTVVLIDLVGWRIGR